jgi:hypothetical protein
MEPLPIPRWKKSIRMRSGLAPLFIRPNNRDIVDRVILASFWGSRSRVPLSKYEAQSKHQQILLAVNVFL